MPNHDPILDDIPTPRPLNEIDELNNRDPLGLISLDIDRLIAYQRTRRAAKASGEKLPKAPSTKPDLSTLLGGAKLTDLIPSAPRPPSPTTPAIAPGSLRRPLK